MPGEDAKELPEVPAVRSAKPKAKSAMKLKKLETGRGTVQQRDLEKRLQGIEKKLDGLQKSFVEMHNRMDEMHRYIFWRKIWTWIRLFLIVVPLILAVVYLPPLLDAWLTPYRELFQQATGVTGGAAPSDAQLESALEKLKMFGG